MISSSSVDSTASISLPTSIITASGSPTIPNFISTQVPSSSYISLVSTAAFASTSSSSSIGAIPATSTTLASKPVLTRPQIAGVATAGAATAVIAIGIFAFFFCCRRRRKNRDSNSSFGQDQLPDIRQSLPSFLVPAINSSVASRQQVAEAPPKAQRFLGVPSRYNEQTWGTYNNAVNPVDIGVGTAPGSGHSTQSSQETPPHSAASYRTTSRLLPDKPTISSLYPAPLNPHSSRRPESAVARSAEGGGIRLIAPEPPPKPEKTFQPKNPVQADPFIDHSNDPRARMYAKERAAKHTQLPLILTAGGEKFGDSSRTLPADSQLSEPPPVHEYQFPRWEGALPLSTTLPNKIQRKPLSQATDTAENPPHSANSSFDPYASSHIRSFRSGSLARRSKGVRPETYLTMGSDTSFEDDCDEADEPPRPNPTLSPVVEQDTPRIRSPISNIRYPPIPGAAASSIQRRQSPPSPTRRPPTRRPNLPPAAPNTRVRQPGHVSFRSPLPQYSNMRQVARPPYQQIAPPRVTSTMIDSRGWQRQQQQYPNDGNTESAKWKILCGPGGQDDLVINLGSAYTGVGAGVGAGAGASNGEGGGGGGGGGGGVAAPLSQSRRGA
ncbi:hypothetical protein MMC14_007465 [Varicellaria rhodocarpa]|nr:hypothetical protein [Varicellaria rhodocarpa]